MRTDGDDGELMGLAQNRVADMDDVNLAAVEGGEFTLSPVPQSATTAAYKIGIMLFAANISMPVLVLGGELGVDIGFKATAWACLWGGLILAALAGSCAYAGARSRLTTYMMIIDAFGRRGGEFVNLLLSFSAIGWTAVIIMLFAGTMVHVIGTAAIFGGLAFWAIAGAILMVSTTIVGFKALNLLSNVMLPLKLGLLMWVVAAAIGRYGSAFAGPPAGPAVLDGKTAISFVVGGWVVGAVVSPDLTRFARRPAGGAFACGSALGGGYPLALLAASIPAILTGDKDLITTMVSLGMGLSALVIVLLASWTNGASNLYSGSLMLATVFRRSRRWVLTCVAGFLGLMLGILGITDLIVPYLLLLSVAVPPIAGIYLPRFFAGLWTDAAPLPPRNWHPEAFIAWGLGIAVAGFGARIGIAITGIAAIDSFLVSGAAYLAFELIRNRRALRQTAKA